MKFLVDHQLPLALAKFLTSQGHEAEHVSNIGLDEATDLLIWRHAISNSMIVISKDEDFIYLAQSPGMGGRLVWVRLGNCRNKKLIEVFAAKLPDIIACLQSGANVVELR